MIMEVLILFETTGGERLSDSGETWLVQLTACDISRNLCEDLASKIAQVRYES